MAHYHEEAPRSMLQAIHSKVDRKYADGISKKRRLRASYYPPRKRARVDLDDVSSLEQKNVDMARKHARTGVEKMANKSLLDSLSDTDTVITTNVTRKRSNNCKRYRRPTMRLPGYNAKKSASSKVEVEAPFRELIAHGAVSHILRECHSKAFARKGSSTRIDSLYGLDEALHSPPRTFRGSALYCNTDGTFQGSVHKARRNSAAHIIPAQPPVDESEDEYVEFHDANDGSSLNENTSTDVKSQCKTRVDEQIKAPVLRMNGTNSQSSPSSAAEVNPASEYSNADLHKDPQTKSLSRMSANKGPLPYNFMPLTTNTASLSTRRRKLSSNGSKVGRGSSKPRSKLSVFCHHTRVVGGPDRSSHLRARTDTSVFSKKNHSPIRPQISKGPILRSLPQSSFSSNGPPIASGNNCQENPTSPARNTVSLMSLPFDFMSKDDPTTQSSTEYVLANANANEASPYKELVSTLKQIIIFAAKWLLGLSTACQNNDDNSNPSAPSPPDRSRKTRTPLSHLEPLSERRPTYSQRPPDRRSSSGKHPSSVPFPRASNRAFLSTNEKKLPIVSTQQNMMPSDRSTTNNNNYVKNPSDILPAPPCGWETFFQPRADEWKCKACYYINPVEAMTCDSCTAHKEDAAWSGRSASYEADDDESCASSCATQEDPTFALHDEDAGDDAASKRDIRHKGCHAARAVTRPAPESMQNNGTVGKGKRIKVVDSVQGGRSNTSGKSPDGFPKTPGSKKRNKSEEFQNDDVEDLAQARKASREEVEGMATDEASLHNSSTAVEMDLDSP